MQRNPVQSILGVFTKADRVYLLNLVSSKNKKFFQTFSGNDVFSFSAESENTELISQKNTKITGRVRDFRFSVQNNRYYATFIKGTKKQPALLLAHSTDQMHWKQIGTVDNLSETACLVSDFTHRGKYVMYTGGKSAGIGYSDDLINWSLRPEPVYNPGNSNFTVIPGSVFKTDDGLILIYFEKEIISGVTRFSLKGIVFDPLNPEKITDRISFWSEPEEWYRRKIMPIGVVRYRNNLITYWNTEKEGLFAVSHPSLAGYSPQKSFIPPVLLKRISQNPLLKPLAAHFWESKQVFNTAALSDGGKVHLIYRAIGDHDTSTLGYAISTDGKHIQYRHDEPIFYPTASLENKSPGTKRGNLSPFMSGGGGFGGCEDPRLTKIDDKYYMTYVHYDGAHPPRVALTSIRESDFAGHNWNWSDPVLISPPGVVDKNACILSEKINGKYVIFHRIFPNILVDYVDDLNFDGKNKWLTGEFMIKPRRFSWDSRKVGVGAPPIKTEDGWLLIYHAVGDQDPGRYKMGAMLLDLHDPSKVLYRTDRPILEPVENYENDGFKAGVVYPCGAVSLNGELIVYYGGADTVVCAATADQNEFIKNLKQSGSIKLAPLSLQYLNAE